jgi:hypothetical protein
LTIETASPIKGEVANNLMKRKSNKSNKLHKPAVKIEEVEDTESWGDERNELSDENKTGKWDSYEVFISFLVLG